VTKFRKPDKTLLSLALISVVLILIGSYKLIDFYNDSLYKYMTTFGYFLQVIIWSLYYYKYHYKKTNN